MTTGAKPANQPRIDDIDMGQGDPVETTEREQVLGAGRIAWVYVRIRIFILHPAQDNN